MVFGFADLDDNRSRDNCERMLKAVIHALMFALVGILLVSATARATGVDRHESSSIHMPGDTEAAPTTDTATPSHDDHGGGPCSHGPCKACCGACAPAVAAVAVDNHALHVEGRDRRADDQAPDHLANLRLSLLPFRPPCAIA